MTDPDLADRTYVEPLTAPYFEEIIRRERPTAASHGRRTDRADLSVELAELAYLRSTGELIGARIDAIKKAEDRLLFKDAMRKIGLETPHRSSLNSVKAASNSGRIVCRHLRQFTLAIAASRVRSAHRIFEQQPSSVS